MDIEDVREVLTTWVNNFLVDVPAVHKDGQYLIEHDTLVDHINGLNEDDLVLILNHPLGE